MPNSYPLIFKLRVIECYNNRSIKIDELLKLFKISRSTLYDWIKRYDNNDLSEKERYTKKSKFDSVDKYISNYVCSRKKFDYLRLISIINRKFKITISKSSIYNILKKNNITRKKINFKLNLCKKDKFIALRKDFDKTIKNTEQDNIVSIDESSFDTHIDNNYGWSIKGQPINVMKKLKRERFSVVSSVTNKKVIYTQLVKGSVRKEQFIEFMKETIKRTNNRSSYLMDNATIHKSKELKQLIDDNKRKIIYNVPYSPENNPIEMVFSKVKLLVKKKRTNDIVNNLKRNIVNGFKKITKQDLTGYFNHSLNK